MALVGHGCSPRLRQARVLSQSVLTYPYPYPYRVPAVLGVYQHTLSTPGCYRAAELYLWYPGEVPTL